MIVIILIIVFILWLLIRFVSFCLVVKEIKRVNKKDFSSIINGFIIFLKKRAERKLFLTFMATEAGIAGVFPQILKANVTIVNDDTKVSLGLNLCQNSEMLSLIIAIIIAIGYFLYIWMSHNNNPEYWRTVVDTCMLIDEEYNFSPTQKWFEEQNVKQIKNLDNRYSEGRNFPFENMNFVLAALEQTDGFWPLLKKDINDFKESLQSFVVNFSDDMTYSDIIQNCKIVIGKISSLNGSVAAYKHLLESVTNLMTILKNFYYSSENYKRHEIYSIREKANHIETVLSNEWIYFKEYHTIIITGEAGTGKSHLIGDIVTHRKRNRKPSILLLGQHFTSASDPLSQIKELLDVKCKKEKLLR